jgi:hypothetical protein
VRVRVPHHSEDKRLRFHGVRKEVTGVEDGVDGSSTYSTHKGRLRPVLAHRVDPALPTNCNLEHRAIVLVRPMHLPHVAGHHFHLEPSGHIGTGFHPLAQCLQRHQLKLADAVAPSVDYGSQFGLGGPNRAPDAPAWPGVLPYHTAADIFALIHVFRINFHKLRVVHVARGPKAGTGT